jgi:hypothetical protein
VTYVIDASVAIKWLVPEALSEEALRLLDAGEELLAPEMLMIEAANVLRHQAGCLMPPRGTPGSTVPQMGRYPSGSGRLFGVASQRRSSSRSWSALSPSS